MLIIILLATTADSLRPDSVVTESSLVVFEIPVIVNPDHLTALDRALYQKMEIIPATYEHRTADLFFHTPYVLSDPRYGISLYGHEAPSILINHHQIDNPFFGRMDLALLPEQLFDRISLREIYAGERTLAIDFISKLNRFERPYSFINFTTLGDDNIYNIDFTRAFNPEAGFYFSGLYVNSYMPHDSLYNKINGYYANLYQNTFLPKRLDFFYVTNSYGPLYSTDLFDVDLVIGNDQHNSCLYYDNSSMAISGSLPDTIVNSRISIMGINNRSTISFKTLEFDLGINASVKRLTSDVYDDDQHADMEFWQKISGSLDRFLFSFAQDIKGRDLLDSARVHYAPCLSIGATVIDSLFLKYGLSQSINEPLLIQRSGTRGMPLLPYAVEGNPTLQNENVLRHQISIKQNDLSLCLYTSTTSDLIFCREDSVGHYYPENYDTWTVRGIEDNLTLPLVLHFTLGHAGSYVLAGDSLARQPKTIHNGFLSWTRLTERSEQTLVLKATYIGERRNIALQKLRPFYVLSTACMLKFITLSFSAVFDNILNETSEDFPNLGSNFSLSVKWEFWD